MLNKVLRFTKIENRVKYQNENSLPCNLALFGLFLVPSPTGSYRNVLPCSCSHWKLCCFFLGYFTKSHSKVIVFDFTCVWVLFRCLTQISMLNHVPYFSNIGNRVKYQNVNSLFFNLGSLFLFPVLLSTASFRNL